MKNTFQIKEFSGTGSIVFLSLQISLMSGLVRQNILSGLAVHLLPSYLIEVYEENQTLHKYVVGKGEEEFLITFSEICGCFPLISHLNLTSGNVSKLSYSVESEITSVNFAHVGLATSCFGHLERWIDWVRWTASSRLFICFMTNSTNTIWCHCWVCAELPAVLPTIVSAVSVQISRWWNRQIVSQYYYRDSFAFADPWVLNYALRNASLREGECSRLISYPLQLSFPNTALLCPASES